MGRWNTKSFISPLTLSWTFKTKIRFLANFKVFSFLTTFAQSFLYTTYTLSTKKDFLHSACSNNGFIFRIRFTLGCRAVRGTTRGRALWRTQVVHQWEAVLSTEVHKFYLSDTTVKVDSCREKGISAK